MGAIERRLYESVEPEAGGSSPAINVMPAASTGEPNRRQDPDPSLPALASREEKEMPRLPGEAAATAKIVPPRFDQRPPDADLAWRGATLRRILSWASLTALANEADQAHAS